MCYHLPSTLAEKGCEDVKANGTPPAGWNADAQPRPGPETAPPIASVAQETEGPQRLCFHDGLGQIHDGFVLRIARWDGNAAAEVQHSRGDFRIVLLAEPPEEPVQPPPRTVVCSPATVPDPPEGTTRVSEAAATFAVTRRPPRLLTEAEARLLSEGKLYAPTELRVTPQEIFGGTKPLLEHLAGDLITCEMLDAYLGPLAAPEYFVL